MFKFVFVKLVMIKKIFHKKIKRAKFSTILSYRILPSKLFAIGMWAQPRPISIHFCLFETVDSYAILLMNEPQITIADCDRSAYLKAWIMETLVEGDEYTILAQIVKLTKWNVSQTCVFLVLSWHNITCTNWAKRLSLRVDDLLY